MNVKEEVEADGKELYSRTEVSEISPRSPFGKKGREGSWERGEPNHDSRESKRAIPARHCAAPFPFAVP